MYELAVSPENAHRAIEERIDLGQRLRETRYKWLGLAKARKAFHQWDQSNRVLLRSLFRTDAVLRGYLQGEFDESASSDAGMAASLDERIGGDPITDFDAHILFLRTLLSRMDYMESETAVTPSGGEGGDWPESSVGFPESGGWAGAEPEIQSKRVFIVHGHDSQLKEAVRGLVKSLGYDPVILSELPNIGRVVVEKFEQESQDVAYAVILLTPDDVGGPQSRADAGPTLQPRARQNVVFELGFFVAKLGRRKVAALITVPESSQNLEWPSDIQGLVAIEVSGSRDTSWQPRLTAEMKAAGLDVDGGAHVSPQ